MSAEPVRFDRFQELLLYDPATGFYASGGGAGRRRGDFLTSPEVGPLFGAVLARALDGWWEELGHPDPFTVVEAGAGRGALALAVRAAEPGCGEALRYVAVERSAALRERAAGDLGDWAEIRPEMPDGPVRGVIVANELLDNLPVRILERTARGWEEVWVTADGSEELRPTELRLDVDARAGTRLPVLAAARAWVSDALTRLRPGRLVAFDYGVRTTAELVGRSWLRTYGGHDAGDDPHADPGRRDITVDVALDQLPPPTLISTQEVFLRRWGIEELVDQGRAVWRERAAIGDLAAIAARSRVVEAEALCDPAGLGGFLVLEWVEGVPYRRPSRDHNRS